MTDPNADDSLTETLRRAGNWCREYLELQHSRDVGAAFGNVMRTFAEIASPTADDARDRFERLKELERRIREVEMENAFLKKCAAYFAKNPR